MDPAEALLKPGVASTSSQVPVIKVEKEDGERPAAGASEEFGGDVYEGEGVFWSPELPQLEI